MVQSSLSPHVNPVVESEPGYGQLFAVLIRRFPWLLLVMVTSVGIAGVITKKTPSTYKSSMQLLTEPNYQGKKEGTGTENQFIDPNVSVDIATQLNIMGSTALIQKVVNKLKPEYPELTVADVKSSLLLDQVSTLR